jgi:hypothetical protein
MNESAFHYVDDPTVALTDRGVVAVAWADQSRKDIFLEIREADGRRRFPAPVNVSRTPRVFSWLPRLVLDAPDGRGIHVLWQEIEFTGGSHGGEIFFARSTDGGRSFGEPVNLSHTQGGAGKGRLTREFWHNGSLDLAGGSDGHLYAAWTEYAGPLRVSRSTDRGATFSPALDVAGSAARPARGPSLAVDRRGVVYLAWTVGEDPAADIHLARSTDGGRSFSQPERILAGRGHADAPKLAVGPGGVLHLAYGESDDGPGGRYRIRHSRSPDGGRTWEPAHEVLNPRGADAESGSFPSLALDARGALYLTWELFPRRGHYPRGLGVTWSADGGRTFAPAALLPGSLDPAGGTNGSQQGLLMRKLAVGGTGALAVVTSTFRPGAGSHIWLIRGRAVIPPAR